MVVHIMQFFVSGMTITLDDPGTWIEDDAPIIPSYICLCFNTGDKKPSLDFRVVFIAHGKAYMKVGRTQT